MNTESVLAIDQLSMYGNDLFGDVIKPPDRGKIANEYLVPPFSVLNTRDGFWQARKRAWIAMGLDGEIGRDAKTYNIKEWVNKHKISGACGEHSGVTIFDPVLTEIMYHWFCPRGGTIVDPFAGGSTRGMVAGLSGYDYWGCELRAEQVAANYEQREKINPARKPIWVQGDSNDELANAPAADFVLSCPPYGNLEVYSDVPGDLSSMDYPHFVESYREIIAKTVQAMAENTFACFVVGNYRGESGTYRDLVGTTVAAFESAGAGYYNEIILVTSVGSLPIRIKAQFEKSRKIGKTHQNVLVFVKGDARIATRKIND